MSRMIFMVGALLAAAGVAAGAFGAHALQARIPTARLATWEIAVRYQLYHALALLILAWAVDRWPTAGLHVTAWLWVAGTAVFGGTLYALALGAPRWFGAITPLGGICLIAGWLLAAWRISRVS